MAQFDQQQSSQRTQSDASTTSTSSTASPGKSTLAQQVPPAGSASSTATAATPTGPSRFVAGDGGYMYQQFADGTIKVIRGPTSVGKILAPSDPVNVAITAQIGPFVPPASPASGAPASTAPAGASPAAAPAAPSAVDSVVNAVTGAVDAVTGAVTGTVSAVVTGVAALFGVAGTASQSPATAAPTAGTPATPAAPEKPGVVPVDPANHQSRASFVGPQLGENAKTTQILDTVWPYFHKDDVAIAGFMTDAELVWKINFHWDEILWACDTVAKMDVPAECKTGLAAIASELNGFPPDPGKGAYLPSPKGVPVDKTSPAAFDARYAAVKGVKPRLRAILEAAGIFAKYPGDKQPGLSYRNACDFVNPPKVSAHGYGYALDIQGNEDRILAAAAKLGMTGKSKEAYTHVEFANGAHPPAAAPAGDTKPA
jgi:hypothetical protein